MAESIRIDNTDAAMVFSLVVGRLLEGMKQSQNYDNALMFVRASQTCKSTMKVWNDFVARSRDFRRPDCRRLPDVRLRDGIAARVASDTCYHKITMRKLIMQGGIPGIASPNDLYNFLDRHDMFDTSDMLDTKVTDISWYKIAFDTVINPNDETYNDDYERLPPHWGPLIDPKGYCKAIVKYLDGYDFIRQMWK